LGQAHQQLIALETGSRPQEIHKAKANVAAEKTGLVDTEQIYHRTQKLVDENFCRHKRCTMPAANIEKLTFKKHQTLKLSSLR